MGMMYLPPSSVPLSAPSQLSPLLSGTQPKHLYHTALPTHSRQSLPLQSVARNIPLILQINMRHISPQAVKTYIDVEAQHLMLPLTHLMDKKEFKLAMQTLCSEAGLV